MIEHEAYLDRQRIDVLSYGFAQSFGFLQSHGILLCRDDDAWLGHRLEGVVDEFDVAWLELMMVAKRQASDVAYMGLEVVLHLFGRCDACEEHDVLMLQLMEWECLVAEEALGIVVVDTREVELLERIETHGFGEHTELHGTKVFWTLGHDDDVGTVLSA